MKRNLLVGVFLVLSFFSGKAQFVRYGGRFGVGASYVGDDLLVRSPIMGVNLGGYVDYVFSNWQNPWAENVYLQTGLNIVRRGTNFRQEFESMKSKGYFHNWYAQIPVLAGFKYEIPQLPAENYISFYVGPAINVGVFGRYWDRHVSPGLPQPSINYDTYRTMDKDARRSFKHIRRIDVSVIFGVTYQWHNFTFDLFMDHGFVPIKRVDDVLHPFDVPDEDGNPNMEEKGSNAYTGVNNAIILSVGYQLPLHIRQ